MFYILSWCHRDGRRGEYVTTRGPTAGKRGFRNQCATYACTTYSYIRSENVWRCLRWKLCKHASTALRAQRKKLPKTILLSMEKNLNNIKLLSSTDQRRMIRQGRARRRATRYRQQWVHKQGPGMKSLAEANRQNVRASVFQLMCRPRQSNVLVRTYRILVALGRNRKST